MCQFSCPVSELNAGFCKQWRCRKLCGPAGCPALLVGQSSPSEGQGGVHGREVLRSPGSKEASGGSRSSSSTGSGVRVADMAKSPSFWRRKAFPASRTAPCLFLLLSAGGNGKCGQIEGGEGVVLLLDLLWPQRCSPKSGTP